MGKTGEGLKIKLDSQRLSYFCVAFHYYLLLSVQSL